MRPPRFSRASSLAVAVAALLPAGSVWAANGTWSNFTPSGSPLPWSTITNWSGNTVANGIGFTADFSNINITADTTVDIGTTADRTIGNLIFGDTTPSNNWFLTGSKKLILAGSTPTITVNNTTVTISTVIATSSGTPGLKKAGTGTLVLSNANTYAGNTQITAGTLKLNNTPSLPYGSGAGNVSITSGSILDVNDRNVSINGLSGAGTVTNSGSSAYELSVGFNDQTSNFSGVIENGTGGGTLGLVKEGSGTLTLSGTNTYTGVTTMTNGILSVASIGNGGVNGNLGGATSSADNIVFNGGTLEYTGTTAITNRGFSINDDVTAVISVGSATNLTISGGSSVASLQTGTGSLNKIGSGTLTLSGANTYGTSTGGTTTVSKGILNVTGSLTNVGTQSLVTVGGDGSSGTPTLAGTGTISGATLISAAGTGVAGTLSPGGRSTDGTASVVGTQTFGSTLTFGAASLFEWQLTSNTASLANRGSAFDGVDVTNTGVTIDSTAIFKIVLNSTGSTVDFSDSFWNTGRSWQVFGNGSGSTGSTSGGFTVIDVDSSLYSTPYPLGNFWYNSSNGTINWAVPEPSNVLAGLLLGAGLLRRRRDVKF